MIAEHRAASHDESLAKVGKLITETQVCMFTTTEASGRMVSRRMAVLQTEFQGELWFITRYDARKVEQLRGASQVNVGFVSRSSWVSIAGEAEVVRDVAKTRELWGPGVSAWFPRGPEDPRHCLAAHSGRKRRVLGHARRDHRIAAVAGQGAGDWQAVRRG